MLSILRQQKKHLIKFGERMFDNDGAGT